MIGWREDMLQDMAAAAAGAIGHPAVVVFGAEPTWSSSARLSAQRPLALVEQEAAEEMAINLGVRHYLIELDAREVKGSRIEDFRLLGLAIYGVRWVSPLASKMDVPLRTAQRWANGLGKGPSVEQLSTAARAAIEGGVDRELETRVGVIRRIAAMRPAAPAPARKRSTAGRSGPIRGT